MYKPKLLVMVALFLLSALLAGPAWAHRVLVFALAEGDSIHVEAKFVPDTPVRQGKVLVQDAAGGEVLLSGETDNQGKFSFPVPAGAKEKRLDLKIVVEAAMGHRGEWLLKADSYLPKRAATAGPLAAPATPAPTPGPVAGKAAALDQQALETALNQALERQLGPIKEMLTQLTVHRTSFTDILGGIGYILGLFGLWAFFAAKQRKDR